MQKGAQEAADRLGVDLVVQAAEREVDVDKQMQIIENLIQTGVKALLRHAQRVEGDRARHRQGQRGRHPRGDRGHARRSRRGQGGGHQDRRPSSARTTTRAARLAGQHLVEITRRQGQGRACSKASPATRPATRGCSGFKEAIQGLARHPDRGLPDRELGARPGLQRLPEHAAGAPGDRRRVRLQRHDGAGGAGGDRGRGQDGQDQGHRLRRRGRRAQGDRRRAPWSARSRSSRPRWAAWPWRARPSCSRASRCPRDQVVRIELVTKANAMAARARRAAAPARR